MRWNEFAWPSAMVQHGVRLHQQLSRAVTAHAQPRVPHGACKAPALCPLQLGELPWAHGLPGLNVLLGTHIAAFSLQSCKFSLGE